MACLGVALPATARAQLAGDCDLDGFVTSSEIAILIDIAFALRPLTDCPAGDLDSDGSIDVAEIVAAVNAKNCGGPCPTPTVTATSPPSPTPTATHTATASPVPIGSCGNGVLEPNEQCDPPFDAACPGMCRTGAASWNCVACGATSGPCSGPSDPSCRGQCVSATTACTCAPNPSPACPPAVRGSRDCPAACAQIGATLFYREEVVGAPEFYAQREITLTGFPDPLRPDLIAVHVRETAHNQNPREFDTQLSFGGGGGGIVTPGGAAGIFHAGLGVYQQLVCGWPIACTGEGDVVIPNGTTYDFELPIGAGQVDRFVMSCSGCGGGPLRVNTIWSGVRCGERAFFGLQDICAGDNLSAPQAAPICCGCPGEVCPASQPACIAGGCQ